MKAGADRIEDVSLHAMMSQSKLHTVPVMGIACSAAI
jgi:hypothetical protein